VWRSDGSKRAVRVAVSRPWPDEPNSVLMTIIDVTDSVEREQRAIELFATAERGGRAGEEFISGMSHELRTPLNAIIGLSGILTQGAFGDLSGKQREMVGQIESSGRALLRLIEDILHLARLSSSESELDVSSAKLRQIAHEALNQRREAADASGVALETRSIPDIEFRATLIV
jgi:signal transduction histidine kinase